MMVRRLLVFGELNRRLFPEEEQGGCWKHCVSVTESGRFWDVNYEGHRSFRKYFEKPPEGKRYMEQIYRVSSLHKLHES